MTQRLRQVALMHLRVQFGVSLFLMLAAGACISMQVAFGFGCGAVACLAPNAYFSWRFSRKSGAMYAKQILSDFYRGEIVKLLMTGAIFWLIFEYIPVTILPVFIGFIMAHAAFWVSLLILKSERAVI